MLFTPNTQQKNDLLREWIPACVTFLLVLPTLIQWKEFNYYFNQDVTLGILTLGIAVILVLTVQPADIRITHTFLCLLFCFTMILIHCIIMNNVASNLKYLLFIMLALIFYLYVPKQNPDSNFPVWLLFGAQLYIVVQVSFAVFGKIAGDQYYLSSFDNPNQFSQFLVFITVFCLADLPQNVSCRKIYTVARTFNFTAIIYIILYNHSRASILGMAIIISVFMYFSKAQKFKIGHAVLLTLLAGFVLSMITKSQSTDGRMLIYRLASENLSENWLLGQGLNEFSRYYNEAQISYFSRPRAEAEIMLADSISYAYNEYLQFAGELGLIVFSLILITLSIVFKGLLQQYRGKTLNHLQKSHLSILIVVAFTSLFNFVLHAYSTIAIILILASLNKQSPSYFYLNAKRRKLLLICTSCFVIVTISISLINLYAVAQYRNASLSKRMGREMLKLKEYMFHNEYYLFNTAASLNEAGFFWKSNDLLNCLMKTRISGQIYSLYGNNLIGTGNPMLAKEAFLKSNSAIPSRIGPKYKLMVICNMLEQYPEAEFWAKSILSTKIKVPSIAADSIKSLATNYIK